MVKFVLYNGENFDIVDVNSGVRLVEDKINEIQDLHTDKMIMEQAGFLEIYLDNQAQTPVYFDNLTVVQSTGNVTEVNAYYPSGMIIGPLSFDAAKEKYNAYKYNAKELQKELNLKWYDHGARMMDPAVGRWWVPDPLAENHYDQSPYMFCGGNPIRFIDPNGEDWRDFLNSLKDKTVENFKNLAHAVTHPVETIKNIASQDAGDIALTAVKMTALGEAVSTAVDVVSAVASDVNGGNGSATGGVTADLLSNTAINLVGAKGGQVVVKEVSKAVSSVTKTVTTGGSNVAKTATEAVQGGNLGNPFKNANLSQVDEAFQTHVKSGKLKLEYSNPKTGAKSYSNTQSGYSYNLDPGGKYGTKVEGPHIDVNYPKPKPKSFDKKKLEVIGGF